MKKQLFSFLMVLALVVLAGTSAMAQNNAATNASNGRYVMITGSSHTFTVTKTVATNSLAWSIVPESGQTSSGTGTQGNAALNEDNKYTVVWDQNAGGSYYIQVVETRSGIVCANTTRRFYVNVLDFDVWVYASDASGARLEGDALSSCGDGTTANYGNETIGGTTGQAFGNTFNTDGVLHNFTGTAALDLNNVEGTDGFTRRYITIGIVWNSGVNTNDATAMAALINQLKFDYAATVSEGLINVNANVGATGTGIITSNKLASTPAILTALNANAIAFTIPMDFNDFWQGASHNDITYILRTTNVTLQNHNAVASTTSTLGIEPDSYEAGNTGIPSATVLYGGYANTSETGTIRLAPATTPISVSQN